MTLKIRENIRTASFNPKISGFHKNKKGKCVYRSMTFVKQFIVVRQINIEI